MAVTFGDLGYADSSLMGIKLAVFDRTIDTTYSLEVLAHMPSPAAAE